MDEVRVAVIGASGYTGAELLRLLTAHPRARVTHLSARERLAPDVSAVLPSLAGVLRLPIEAFDAEALASRADVAFACLPHGASIEVVRALYQRGVRVFDLSADFRLRDPATYAQWYGHAHGAPELLETAVYGLVEKHRAQLRDARLVAVPGCYPTASSLPVLPLLEERLVRPDDVVVHALSGVSGAGRTPSPSTHYSECAESARSYKIAGTHRHIPELEQTLSAAAGAPVTLTFTPTLVPMTRGILSTVYLRPAGALPAAEELTALARRYYEGSPFVTVLDAGTPPDTLWVRGSNRVHLSYAVDARAGRILAMGAIDNLVKGASGQAIQCMNVALGFDERAGLGTSALWP